MQPCRAQYPLETGSERFDQVLAIRASCRRSREPHKAFFCAEAQVKQLRAAGAEKVFRETASGARTDRQPASLVSFHPKDFTPVCTTELGYMAKIKPEFDKRGVKIIGLSVDPVEKHSGGAADIKEP